MFNSQSGESLAVDAARFCVRHSPRVQQRAARHNCHNCYLILDAILGTLMTLPPADPPSMSRVNSLTTIGGRGSRRGRGGGGEVSQQTQGKQSRIAADREKMDAVSAKSRTCGLVTKELKNVIWAKETYKDTAPSEAVFKKRKKAEDKAFLNCQKDSDNEVLRDIYKELRAQLTEPDRVLVGMTSMYHETAPLDTGIGASKRKRENSADWATWNEQVRIPGSDTQVMYFNSSAYQRATHEQQAQGRHAVRWCAAAARAGLPIAAEWACAQGVNQRAAASQFTNTHMCLTAQTSFAGRQRV